MNKFVKNVALYVLLIIIAVSIFNTFVHPQEKHSEITYSDFISQAREEECRLRDDDEQFHQW